MFKNCLFSLLKLVTGRLVYVTIPTLIVSKTSHLRFHAVFDWHNREANYDWGLSLDIAATVYCVYKHTKRS